MAAADMFFFVMNIYNIYTENQKALINLSQINTFIYFIVTAILIITLTF